MPVDPEARPAFHVGRDARDARIVEFHAPAARRADHVVVMRRLAGDIGMLAAGKVEPLDEAKVGEQLQGAEYRRSTDADPARGRVIDELARREVAVPARNELRHGAARFGTADPGVGQSIEKGLRVDHSQMILSLNKSRWARSRGRWVCTWRTNATSDRRPSVDVLH